MSSSFVKDCSDVSSPGAISSGKTVIIIVNNEIGNIAFDGDQLQNLLASHGADGSQVSVVRMGNEGSGLGTEDEGPCGSEANITSTVTAPDGTQLVNLTVEGFPAIPIQGGEQVEAVGGSYAELPLDADAFQRLESVLESEEAREILGEPLLDMVTNPAHLPANLTANLSSLDELMNSSLFEGEGEETGAEGGASDSSESPVKKAKSPPKRRSQRQMDKAEREEVEKILAENKKQLQEERQQLDEENSIKSQSIEEGSVTVTEPSEEAAPVARGRGRGRGRGKGRGKGELENNMEGKGRGKGKKNTEEGDVIEKEGKGRGGQREEGGPGRGRGRGRGRGHASTINSTAEVDKTLTEPSSLSGMKMKELKVSVEKIDIGNTESVGDEMDVKEEEEEETNTEEDNDEIDELEDSDSKKKAKKVAVTTKVIPQFEPALFSTPDVMLKTPDAKPTQTIMVKATGKTQKIILVKKQVKNESQDLNVKEKHSDPTASNSVKSEASVVQENPNNPDEKKLTSNEVKPRIIQVKNPTGVRQMVVLNSARAGMPKEALVKVIQPQDPPPEEEKTIQKVKKEPVSQKKVTEPQKKVVKEAEQKKVVRETKKTIVEPEKAIVESPKKATVESPKKAIVESPKKVLGEVEKVTGGTGQKEVTEEAEKKPDKQLGGKNKGKVLTKGNILGRGKLLKARKANTHRTFEEMALLRKKEMSNRKREEVQRRREEILKKREAIKKRKEMLLQKENSQQQKKEEDTEAEKKKVIVSHKIAKKVLVNKIEQVVTPQEKEVVILVKKKKMIKAKSNPPTSQVKVTKIPQASPKVQKVVTTSPPVDESPVRRSNRAIKKKTFGDEMLTFDIKADAEEEEEEEEEEDVMEDQEVKVKMDGPEEEEEEDDSMDDNGEEDDDPERLWCICQRPHNNRFMICCDRCEDWFHGSCVSITKAIGQQMEEDGQEWVCPKCKKTERAMKGSTLLGRQLCLGDEVTTLPGHQDIKKATGVGQVTPSKKGEAARNGDALAGKYSLMKKVHLSPKKVGASHIIRLGSRKLSEGGKEFESFEDAAGAAVVLEKSEPRVLVYEKATGKIISGSEAPTLSHMKEWLRTHPGYEALQPGMMVTEGKFVTTATTSQASPANSQKKVVQVSSRTMPVGGKVSLTNQKLAGIGQKIGGTGQKVTVMKSADGHIIVKSTDTVERMSTKFIPVVQSTPKSVVEIRTSTSAFIPAAREGDGRRDSIGRKKDDAMPAKATLVKTTPVKAMPVKAMPVKTTPVKTTPVKTTPVKTTPVKTMPVKTTPAKATLPKDPRRNLMRTPSVERKRPELMEKKKPESTEKRKPESVEKKKPELGEKKKADPVEKKKPEAVERKRSDSVEKKKPEAVERKRSDSVEKKKPDPEEVRFNVKKTLVECLTKRFLDHKAEFSALTEEDIKQLVEEVEKELYLYCGKDVGFKYRSRYRSILFNAKDPKNSGLFRNILRGTISPSQLARMTSEELASKELCEWREREEKKELEAIEKYELDMIALGNQYIMKSHKGEIVIDKDDFIKDKEKAPETLNSLPADPLMVLLDDTTASHHNHIFDQRCKVCTELQEPASLPLDTKSQEEKFREKLSKEAKECRNEESKGKEKKERKGSSDKDRKERRDSSDKDRHRHRSKDHYKDKDRSKDKERHKNKVKDKHSDSKDRERHKSSDSKNKDGKRDKEEGRRDKEDGRRNKEDGRHDKEDGRRNKEDGRRNKEDGRWNKEDWRRDKEDWRRDKEDGRKDKEDVRRGKEDVRQEKEDGKRDRRDSKDGDREKKHKDSKHRRDFREDKEHRSSIGEHKRRHSEDRKRRESEKERRKEEERQQKEEVSTSEDVVFDPLTLPDSHPMDAEPTSTVVGSPEWSEIMEMREPASPSRESGIPLPPDYSLSPATPPPLPPSPLPPSPLPPSPLPPSPPEYTPLPPVNGSHYTGGDFGRYSPATPPLPIRYPGMPPLPEDKPSPPPPPLPEDESPATPPPPEAPDYPCTPPLPEYDDDYTPATPPLPYQSSTPPLPDSTPSTPPLPVSTTPPLSKDTYSPIPSSSLTYGEEDQDQDRLTPPPHSPSTRPGSNPIAPEPVSVWKGFIHMPDVAKFSASAFEVSGKARFLPNDVPGSIDVVGRIAPETVWSYIAQMKKSGSKEILVVRFQPANEQEKVTYIALYSYLSSKKRYAVIGNCEKSVKDFYVVPLASHQPIPQVLLPLNGPGFEEQRAHMLIGVIVRAKSKRVFDHLTGTWSIVPGPPLPPVKANDMVERSYTPPLPTDEDIQAIALAAKDEDGFESDDIEGPAFEFQEPGSRKRRAKGGAGGGQIKRQNTQEKSPPLASSSIKDNPSSPPDDSYMEASLDQESMLAELNRQIEVHKKELCEMQKTIGNEEDEPYSPSGSHTPPLGADQLKLDTSKISIPSNLQEILDNIKHKEMEIKQKEQEIKRRLSLTSDPIVMTYGKYHDFDIKKGSTVNATKTDKTDVDLRPLLNSKSNKDIKKDVDLRVLKSTTDEKSVKTVEKVNPEEDVDLRVRDPRLAKAQATATSQNAEKGNTLSKMSDEELLAKVMEMEINEGNSRSSLTEPREEVQFQPVPPPSFMPAGFVPPPGPIIITDASMPPPLPQPPMPCPAPFMGPSTPMDMYGQQPGRHGGPPGPPPCPPPGPPPGPLGSDHGPPGFGPHGPSGYPGPHEPMRHERYPDHGWEGGNNYGGQGWGRQYKGRDRDRGRERERERGRDWNRDRDWHMRPGRDKGHSRFHKNKKYEGRNAGHERGRDSQFKYDRSKDRERERDRDRDRERLQPLDDESGRESPFPEIDY